MRDKIIYTILVQRGGFVSEPVKGIYKEVIFRRARGIKYYEPKSIVTVNWFANNKERVALIRSNGNWEMVSAI